jgi:CSLREA domain-containing protein
MIAISNALQATLSRFTSQPIATDRRRNRRVFGFAIAAAAAVLWLNTPIARAQSVLTVTTLADSSESCGSPCSLRDAITEANSDNSGDTIVFAGGLTGTITLTSALPAITSTDLTIQGPGANVITISGAGQYPILWTTGSGLSEWVISGLTFAHGNANGAQVSNGGAISGFIVSVSNSVFIGNTATGSGGAIYGESTVDQSTFRGNSAASGGAVGSPVDVMVTDSTFTGNTSSGAGGAVGAFTVSATNNTFVSNTAGTVGGAIDATDDISANNDIFSGNSSASGGAALQSHGSGTSYVGDVFFNNLPSDCSGCSSTPSDALSSPLTLPFVNWGGTTYTYLPQPGSAAICAGSAIKADAAGVVSDERGFPLSSCVDAGAVQSNYVEVQASGDSGLGAGDCPGSSCTLRDAIAAAGSADGDIYFANGVSTVNLNPGNGTLAPTGSLPTINVVGPGASTLTINGSGSSGSQLSVFTSSPSIGATMAIYGATITGGYSAYGGGIDSNSGGTVSVLDSVVTGNTATQTGGGVLANGTAVIAGSAITGNMASLSGGGVQTIGQLTITDSTVSGNNLYGSSAVYGAGILNIGTMTMNESTVNGNTISTLASSGYGAGVFATGAITSINNTIANNSDMATGGAGGGIEASSATLTLANSIVSGNSSPANLNIDGSYTDNGGNVIGGETTGNNLQNGTGAAISLSSLTYNGVGMTNTTMIPTPGDPAICAGLAANIPAGVTTDQRGGPVENTTYNGYSPSTPCVDSGAVQTNYAIQFTTEPQSIVLEYYPLTGPDPVVGLLESGVAFGANTGTVTMTDSSGDLGGYISLGNPAGTTSEPLVSGSATFGSLAVNLQPATQPMSYSNDILTATLPLDTLTSITAESSDINVNPEMEATLTPSTGTIGSSQMFCWNNGTGPTTFVFYLGSIAQGENDVYSSGVTTQTCQTVNNIPQGGVTLFGTLRQFIWGANQNLYYNNFTEGGTTTPATLTASTSGSVVINSSTYSVLTTPTATFSWANGAGPSQYELLLGTTAPGSSNLYSSGIVPYTTTSETASIPSNGVVVYATLRQRISGVWQSTAYTFAEPGAATPATLYATTSGGPASSGTLTSPSATFSWNNGLGIQYFKVLVGTEGQGSANLYSSGQTTKTSATVSIPSGGVTVWAELEQEINGVWQTPEYLTFTEPGTEANAVLYTATPSCPATPPVSPTIQLAAPTTIFCWNNGNGPAEYLLKVGTKGQGSSDLYNGSPTTNTATLNATLNNIPGNGTNVYIEFGQLVNDLWQYNYYVMSTGSPTYATLSTSPTSQQMVPSSPDTTFYFINGNGPTEYYLWLGTGPSGASQHNIYKGTMSTATQASVTTIPDDGVTIYATLFELFNGTWTSFSSTFSAPGAPLFAQLSPPSNSTLTSRQLFSWTGGVGPTDYQLMLGTTGVGSSNIYNGPQTTTTSVTLTIPSHSATLYATLMEEFNGSWQTIDNYTYTEP